MRATAGDIIVARALMAISDAGDAVEDWRRLSRRVLSLNNLRIALAAALSISIDATRSARVVV